MTWLSLMKVRSEILSIFKRLHKEISIQFNYSLKILGSNIVQHACATCPSRLLYFSWYNSLNFVCSYISTERCCWENHHFLALLEH